MQLYATALRDWRPCSARAPHLGLRRIRRARRRTSCITRRPRARSKICSGPRWAAELKRAEGSRFVLALGRVCVRACVRARAHSRNVRIAGARHEGRRICGMSLMLLQLSI
jgi:hypothetical protein